MKQSHLRLAEILLDHPDTGKWVEWSSIDVVRKRADEHLSSGHRFDSLTSAQIVALGKLKKMRNAVAHKSDEAWEKFKITAAGAPYSVPRQSFRGMTAGRFLSAHQVGGRAVFLHSTEILRGSATTIVP